jgi:hypothetical protein
MARRSRANSSSWIGGFTGVPGVGGGEHYSRRRRFPDPRSRANPLCQSCRTVGLCPHGNCCPVVACRPSVDPSVAQAGRLITKIIDDQASINQEVPRCINNALFGQLTMITSARPGFPLDAVTISKIQNGSPVTVSHITVRGGGVDRDDVIEQVAQFLNDRASERERVFAALCSASRSAGEIAPTAIDYAATLGCA